jgi:hypothetical protein
MEQRPTVFYLQVEQDMQEVKQDMTRSVDTPEHETVNERRRTQQ